MAIKDFPDDLSTIFSIAPFGSIEFKPGLYPGRFEIPPCLDDAQPARLVITASEHLVNVAGRKVPLRVITPSFEVAKSIVTDFLDGQLFSTPEAHPGICWMPGDVSISDFKLKHVARFANLKDVQRRWLVLIVKKTQDDWNKYHNSRVVSDQARFAVRALNMDIPEWMTTDQLGETEATKCPACGTVNNPDNAWCSNCIMGGVKVIINEERFKTLKLAD